jgi:hypothetical protein
MPRVKFLQRVAFDGVEDQQDEECNINEESIIALGDTVEVLSKGEKKEEKESKQESNPEEPKEENNQPEKKL